MTDAERGLTTAGGGRPTSSWPDLEIRRVLADSASTTDTAESLGIRPMTVQSHVKNILAKLGVHPKVEAVTMAGGSAWIGLTQHMSRQG